MYDAYEHREAERRRVKELKHLRSQRVKRFGQIVLAAGAALLLSVSAFGLYSVATADALTIIDKTIIFGITFLVIGGLSLIAGIIMGD